MERNSEEVQVNVDAGAKQYTTIQKDLKAQIRRRRAQIEMAGITNALTIQRLCRILHERFTGIHFLEFGSNEF
jgi:hypothetical protein